MCRPYLQEQIINNLVLGKVRTDSESENRFSAHWHVLGRRYLPFTYCPNMSDYILTIDSDTEDTFKSDAIDDVKLDPDFEFDPTGDPYSEIINKSLGIEDFVKTGSKPVRPLFSALQFK